MAASLTGFGRSSGLAWQTSEIPTSWWSMPRTSLNPSMPPLSQPPYSPPRLPQDPASRVALWLWSSFSCKAVMFLFVQPWSFRHCFSILHRLDWILFFPGLPGILKTKAAMRINPVFVKLGLPRHRSNVQWGCVSWNGCDCRNLKTLVSHWNSGWGKLSAQPGAGLPLNLKFIS